jgi:hypothetical protein
MGELVPYPDVSWACWWEPAALMLKISTEGITGEMYIVGSQ